MIDLTTATTETYKSKILSATVETLRADTDTGYHVTIKAYASDRGRLSVFIDRPDYSDSIFKIMGLDEVDTFIEANTGGG